MDLFPFPPCLGEPSLSQRSQTHRAGPRAVSAVVDELSVKSRLTSLRRRSSTRSIPTPTSRCLLLSISTSLWQGCRIGSQIVEPRRRCWTTDNRQVCNWGQVATWNLVEFYQKQDQVCPFRKWKWSYKLHYKRAFYPEQLNCAQVSEASLPILKT